MAFKLNINNIGKLTDAEIRIGQFTVLAGPNNTGKSFVSKLLYSFFNAMNADPAEVNMDALIRPVRSTLKRLIPYKRSGNEDSPLRTIRAEVEELEARIESVPTGDSEELGKMLPELAKQADRIQRAVSDIDLEPGDRYGRKVQERLEALKEGLKKGREQFISDGIKYNIRWNRIQNFQVEKISDLKGREDKSSEIDIGDLGKFEFSNDEVAFDITAAGLQQLQQYSNVIYLESPVYWKLKNALEFIRFPRYSYRGGREPILGIPGYFYDLARALRTGYTGVVAFPELYRRLTKDVVGGKIAISESGDLSFQENERSFSLPVTALGAANLGILALLIERKVLDEECFLFVDEPEAHLHPAWQVEMARVLIELSRSNVNVVIATHSVDMLKAIEVHIKENPQDQDLVALNHFSDQGV